MEHDLTSPSMQTLFSILEVLEISVQEFFSNEDDLKIVSNPSEFSITANDELHNKISWIVPNAQKYEMEPILVEIEPKGRTEIDDPHPGEEFGYVLDGTITLVYNKKRYIIKKGETFYYLSNKEHYLINAGNSVARVLWISTPPMF